MTLGFCAAWMLMQMIMTMMVKVIEKALVTRRTRRRRKVRMRMRMRMKRRRRMMMMTTTTVW
jgi:hypothetical protein